MAITLESFEFEKSVSIMPVGDDKYKSPKTYIQEFFTFQMENFISLRRRI